MVSAGILAGGYGKRLRPLTGTVPKVMLEISPGLPLLEHTLCGLKMAGIDEVFLMVGHLWDRIEAHFGEDFRGVKVHYLVEDRPKGTHWAVRNLMSEFGRDGIVLLNGDVYTEIDWTDLISRSESNASIMTLVHTRMRSPYGMVRVDAEGRVTGFEEKPLLDIRMNAGIYYLGQGIVEYLPEMPDGTNIEQTAFPALAGDGKAMGYPFDGFHQSIDGQKDLDRVRERLRQLYQK